MQYSRDSLKQALDVLLPDVQRVKELGVIFDFPEQINMVASKEFLRSEQERREQNYTETGSLWLVQLAARELKVRGFITFGEEEFQP